MRSKQNCRRQMLSVLGIAWALVCFLPALANARTVRLRSPQGGTTEARIEEMLRQTGYDFHRVKVNSWYIERAGKVLPRMRIIMGASSTSMAIGAVVAPKRNLRLSAEGLNKMMKLSYDFNYVRLCIDTDDDLIVMTQLKSGLLSVPELKDTIERVAAAADRAYGELGPYIAAP